MTDPTLIAADDLIKSMLKHKLWLEQLTISAKFGDNEKEILSLFYDERLKIRRQKVPAFFMYARVCDNKQEDEWSILIAKADQALTNLESIGYIQEINLNTMGKQVSGIVGNASKTYGLTAEGLEILQSWHPPIALRLKAWIAVLPPWLVLVGSIAGAISAIWKIADLIL